MSPSPTLTATPRFPARPRSPRLALALLLSLGLAACAQLPTSSAPRASLNNPETLGSQTLAGSTAGSWPADRWWARYQDAQLDQLIDEALRDAPDMASAAARLRQAEASTQVSGAALQPRLDASASATSQKQSYNYLTPRSMTPEGWNDYGRATLDFSWELDFWGKNRAALAAATSEQDARRADLAQARLTLTSAVASAYAELTRLYAAREAAERSLEVRTRTATLMHDREAHGLETRGSSRAADARQASAAGDLAELDESIGLQRQRIAALIGAGPDRATRITRPSVLLGQAPALPATLPAELLGRRPDLVAARLQAEAEAQRIRQKTAAFYPDVNLSAFVGLQSLGLDLLRKSGSEVGSVGPAISLPIFNGGRLRGELRASEAAYDLAVASYNQTLTRALQEVADALLSQRALEQRLTRAEEAYQAAGEAYRITHQRYTGGLASYLEVLSAEDTLLASIRSLTDLQSRAFTLDVALVRALGGGYQQPRG